MRLQHLVEDERHVEHILHDHRSRDTGPPAHIDEAVRPVRRQGPCEAVHPAALGDAEVFHGMARIIAFELGRVASPLARRDRLAYRYEVIDLLGQVGFGERIARAADRLVRRIS